MTTAVTAAQVRLDLLARREIALLDLREEAHYADAHPLFAACLPLSRLELEALDRIPRKDVRVVVYDGGEGLAAIGAARLAALGYTDVAELQGGPQGWRDAGFELFQDVNSASKAFGELVEARRHTPSLPAPEAKALIETDPNVVVLDARRFDEYRTMSIPRGVSVPGAELVLRAGEIAPDPSTTIIVNCAGRTRSIIGAQSLINAGVPNRVVALRNGTIGWTLAGQALEHGQARRFPEPSTQAAATAATRARAVAYRAGVRWISAAELREISRLTDRTLYRFDVRTPEEYAAGHIPGFRNAPGGQLVQETDVFAPVRGARIVLADDWQVRACMSASWLAQMGWDVLVLDGGFDGSLETSPWTPTLPPLPEVAVVRTSDLHDRLEASDVVLIDLAPSADFAKGHIPGAWFAIRSRLDEALKALPAEGDLVVTSPDGAAAAFAAGDLARLTPRRVLALQGGSAAWIAAGLPLATGPAPAASPPDDRYRRPYEGTDNAASAMQAYLDWEYGLVAQLERDGTHGFFVI
jgi:rhodanese-related sulfurtransferase